jgi:hypothetical protein
MNVYFEPGPDGRRPIVDRAPACRPMAFGTYPIVWLEDAYGRAFVYENTERGFRDSVDEYAALALCRCAVEDWLPDGWTYCRGVLPRFDSPEPFMFHAYTRDQGKHVTHQDRDEAANAFAHAVADALGVPH